MKHVLKEHLCRFHRAISWLLSGGNGAWRLLQVSREGRFPFEEKNKNSAAYLHTTFRRGNGVPDQSIPNRISSIHETISRGRQADRVSS